MKKYVAIIAALSIAMLSVMFFVPASASTNTDCTNSTTTVVDSAAYDETVVVTQPSDEVVVDVAALDEVVHHPEVTHVVHHDAVTHVVHHDAVAATVGDWWNFSPNDNNAPLDGEPAWPVDVRGTWQGPHTDGGPVPDAEGTYNTSNDNSGHASWFHREAGVTGVAASDETVIDVPSSDETVVDHAAYDETVHHNAVTHVVHHDAVTSVVHHDAVTHEVTNPNYPCVPTKPDSSLDISIKTLASCDGTDTVSVFTLTDYVLENNVWVPSVTVTKKSEHVDADNCATPPPATNGHHKNHVVVQEADNTTPTKHLTARPAGVLPNTGADDVAPWAILGLLLIVGGFAVLKKS